ncbi:ankyrin repeat domain-containing protein 40 isoform X3 [Numida meleagris]|uniref:ankyrin repeat domain-containing protein 40 isoform X1 n=1 Tax=Numida meleagris TaxID=8996 RepID=UPI000B3E316F|nr:ankyrin repeat domain-containing protein 40 isoform X1 [Numida meleagris]XP_021270922.1 ankyrin repeat domain-containing protein 40 isoform X2 [Numida meleagris]XP_021270923.1 ankyrin repeat domain-containing protein 40 isoform X3 [Numida meleagris]
MEAKELQERLREAAALGDAEEVRRLLALGVSPNAQNEVNGWTCLHWACKRNHAPVVAQLLLGGADAEILTRKGERPAQLTSRREIRRMLGVEEDELPDVTTGSELPIIPNYLANPPFPYIYNSTSSSVPEPPANGSVSRREWQGSASSPLPAAEPCARALAPSVSDGALPPVPGGCAGAQCSRAAAQSALFQASWGRAPPSPAGPQQPGAPPGSGSCAGPVPTFQPVFFTGAFPLNMQELVLKVRIQNPSLKENDFIEIELDRQELTYKELLRVSCRELGVNPGHVQKIRKLPNTMLRKDKDVARLQDFQELELVLTVSDKNFPFRVPALSEQSGYNKKASELTY